MSGEFGLRVGAELPAETVYQAHLLLDAVALKPVGEDGEMARAVELDAVVPFSLLQTPEEIINWQTSEAERAAQASRRGVQIGSDRRDWGNKVMNAHRYGEADAESGEPPLKGMGVRPTAEERAAADAALQRHNSQINSRTKPLYH